MLSPPNADVSGEVLVSQLAKRFPVTIIKLVLGNLQRRMPWRRGL